MKSKHFVPLILVLFIIWIVICVLFFSYRELKEHEEILLTDFKKYQNLRDDIFTGSKLQGDDRTVAFIRHGNVWRISTDSQLKPLIQVQYTIDQKIMLAVTDRVVKGAYGLIQDITYENLNLDEGLLLRLGKFFFTGNQYSQFREIENFLLYYSGEKNIFLIVLSCLDNSVLAGLFYENGNELSLKKKELGKINRFTDIIAFIYQKLMIPQRSN